MIDIREGEVKNMKNKIFNVAIILFVAIVVILIVNHVNTPESGELVQIDYEELLEKVEEKEDFVLVVSQSTCSHCATYKPKLKMIAEDYGLDIFYIDYDVEVEEDQKEFLEDFHLSGATPMTLFFKDGKEKSLLNRLEGDLSTKKVLEKLEKMGFID